MDIKPRGKRRARTLTVSLRRQALHLAFVHAGKLGKIDCVCELAAFYFAKRRGRGGCNCRRRRHGQPRLDRGMCWRDWRQDVYRRRRRWRETCVELLSARLSPDEL